MFEEDNAWKAILDGTWADFDAKEVPNGSQLGFQIELNMASKNNPKIRSVLDRS